MAGNAGTRASAKNVATQVSTEGVALYIAVNPGDYFNPSLANLPSVGNVNNYAIDGSMNITAGAGTTAVVVRCRRGNGVTGAVVGQVETDTLAATNSASIPFDFTDQNAPANTFTGYSITVTQTGGTGAGNVSEIDGSVFSYA